MTVARSRSVFQVSSTIETKFPCFVFLSALLLPLFVAGCSGGGSKEKVDVQAQMQHLKSADTETRVNACVELAKAGPNAAPAVSALIAALKDSDFLVRRLSANALGQIGPKAKEAVPALKEAANDRDASVRTEAIGAMQGIDPTAAAGMKAMPNVTN